MFSSVIYLFREQYGKLEKIKCDIKLDNKIHNQLKSTTFYMYIYIFFFYIHYKWEIFFVYVLAEKILKIIFKEVHEKCKIKIIYKDLPSG